MCLINFNFVSHNNFFTEKLIAKKFGRKYDAIIVAVSHKQFKAYTRNDYEQLSSGEKVIIDIKNIVDSPTWRL